LDIYFVGLKERLIAQLRKMAPMAVLRESLIPKGIKRASISKKLSIYYEVMTKKEILDYFCKNVVKEKWSGGCILGLKTLYFRPHCQDVSHPKGFNLKERPKAQDLSH
jgi:hypothetical protein